jgi:hypothetical protein
VYREIHLLMRRGLMAKWIVILTIAAALGLFIYGTMAMAGFDDGAGES